MSTKFGVKETLQNTTQSVICDWYPVESHPLGRRQVGQMNVRREFSRLMMLKNTNDQYMFPGIKMITSVLGEPMRIEAPTVEIAQNVSNQLKQVWESTLNPPETKIKRKTAEKSIGAKQSTGIERIIVISKQ